MVKSRLIGTGLDALRENEVSLQGTRRRKKLAGFAELIGMTFEKAPVSSRVPVLLVFQLIGAERFVAVSQV